MKTSKTWVKHFEHNAKQLRINWHLTPELTVDEMLTILPSLQAWQLGETSDGNSLIKAATRYAWHINDTDYVTAIRLFIKEEQKHGENLGRYLDAIQKPRIHKNWGDSLFRWMRHFNTSMEAWTLAVISIESIAQIFYQALKDATGCNLLKQICTDILIDEAYHITFQTERLHYIFSNRTAGGKSWRKPFYQLFFYSTAMTVWLAHHQIFEAGGHNLSSYLKRVNHKYLKTISHITQPVLVQVV